LGLEVLRNQGLEQAFPGQADFEGALELITSQKVFQLIGHTYELRGLKGTLQNRLRQGYQGVSSIGREKETPHIYKLNHPLKKLPLKGTKEDPAIAPLPSKATQSQIGSQEHGLSRARGKESCYGFAVYFL
jgi:hypothetical protein